MRESILVRYDPSDVSQVYVFHENKFVCIATCSELEGTKPSLQDVIKARKSRLKYLRSTISSARNVVKSYAHQSGRDIPPTDPIIPTVQKPTPAIKRYSVDA